MDNGQKLKRGFVGLVARYTKGGRTWVGADIEKGVLPLQIENRKKIEGCEKCMP